MYVDREIFTYRNFLGLSIVSYTLHFQRIISGRNIFKTEIAFSVSNRSFSRFYNQYCSVRQTIFRTFFYHVSGYDISFLHRFGC